MDIEQQIHELAKKAFHLRGPAALDSLDEAIRLADEINRADLQYDLRRDFIHLAYQYGEADRLLVALSWCLGMHESRPGEFNDYDILPECQLALQYVCSFLRIPREQIYGLIDDTQRRYQTCGASNRSLLLNRCFIAFWMGDLDLAEQHLSAMRLAPQDNLYHPDWEMILEADYHRHAGQWQRLLQCSSGSDFSRDYPTARNYVLSYSLLPLLRLGRGDEAALMLQAINLYRSSREIDPAADQMTYLFAAGKFDRGIRQLEDLSRDGLTMPADKDRFQYFAAVSYAMDRLSRSGQAQAPIHLPKTFPQFTPGQHADTRSLAAVARHEADELAAAFNARNGNSHFTLLLERLDDLQQFELSPSS